jgi:hypothetical protein
MRRMLQLKPSDMSLSGARPNVHGASNGVTPAFAFYSASRTPPQVLLGAECPMDLRSTRMAFRENIPHRHTARSTQRVIGSFAYSNYNSDAVIEKEICVVRRSKLARGQVEKIRRQIPNDYPNPRTGDRLGGLYGGSAWTGL